MRAAGSCWGSLLFLRFPWLQEPPCTPRSSAQPQNSPLLQLHASLTDEVSRSPPALSALGDTCSSGCSTPTHCPGMILALGLALAVHPPQLPLAHLSPVSPQATRPLALLAPPQASCDRPPLAPLIGSAMANGTAVTRRARAAEASPNIATLCPCAGFGWDRVNFLHSSSYGAVFWICAGNSADNTGMFSLLLSSAYTESRPFLLLTPPHQRGGWGCTRSWEGTQRGQLTPTDQRDIPYHMT